MVPIRPKPAHPPLIKANQGESRRIKANQGESRRIKANQGQSRPIKANQAYKANQSE
jgi:hypothetical protein